MRLPPLPQKNAGRQMIDVFKGYNHNLRLSDGEFFEMKNMTSDYYPVLSPRGQRGIYARPASPQGMIAKDQLCYVDGSCFVIGDTAVEMGLSVEESMCPKRMVSMGAYVIIMPDKMYINTMDTEDRGSIEATCITSQEVNISLCSISGEVYEKVTAAQEAPEEPENMAYWIDTAATPHVLMQYSAVTASWVSVASTYVRISSPGIGAKFSQYDGVTISGILAEEAKDLNASIVIQDRGDDYIVVTGILDEVLTQTEPVTVARNMPNMDFLVECNNRLWGCRYGKALNGEMVNEIYACKLGDFKNWNCFMGISTDSYAASCGTDGAFTGAITHLGYPLFFKENCIHKVYGNYPANFGIQDTVCRGVQAGCERSLAIVNEILYYKARSCICAYDGSLPAEVSYCLGEQVYRNAVGGALRNKYYISMEDPNGIWHLFVYDTAKRLWHREDNLHADALCAWQGELYCIDHETRNIITMLGSGDRFEDAVAWMVQTGELGISSPDMKYIARMVLRLCVEEGTVIDIYAQYDQDSTWNHICNIRGTALRSFSVPLRPRRCDHMKLRIEGLGSAKIYSRTNTIEQGSDRS